MGGHSGLNISEDRGNAVVLAALVLQAVVKAHPDVRIISLTAGDKRNAIAREASAILEVRKWALLRRLTVVGECWQTCLVVCTWAARYDIWLLIELTPRCVVIFSFVSSLLMSLNPLVCLCPSATGKSDV